MLRRTRNQLCIWIIFGGLLNFVIYTIVYAVVGGDARNGGHGKFIDSQGVVQEGYYISGHFIHGVGGESRGTSRPLWIYSYLHSVSLWPTMGVVMIAMLVLARPHIIATMRESTWIRGPTFIGVAITLIAVFSTAMTAWFLIGFVAELRGT